MNLALTTRWNAGRHEDGESMIGEIIDLGFDRVELGFDTSALLIPGVRRMAETGRIRIDSVHAYCPMPPIVPHPTPEPFTLADPDQAVRRLALRYMEDTIRHAADIGARVVVAHAGNVNMTPLTPKLAELIAAGRQYEDAYETARMKLIVAREKAVPPQLTFLYESIEKLLPLLDRSGRVLAFEILPTWESIPTEVEMEALLRHFNSPRIRCWHDIGHGQIRQNIGFTSHARWFKRLLPWTAGVHIHDVLPPFRDHLMPPLGKIDFSLFRNAAQGDMIRVLEPTPAATGDEIRAGVKALEVAWDLKGETGGA